MYIPIQDGIYPNWPLLFKSLLSHLCHGKAQQLWNAWQMAFRKEVERAFGVLLVTIILLFCHMFRRVFIFSNEQLACGISRTCVMCGALALFCTTSSFRCTSVDGCVRVVCRMSDQKLNWIRSTFSSARSTKLTRHKFGPHRRCPKLHIACGTKPSTGRTTQHFYMMPSHLTNFEGEKLQSRRAASAQAIL